MNNFLLEEEYESDLDLGIEINTEENNQEQELQRTEQWRINRLGLLTGSKGKLIMACNRKGSRLSWADKEKVFEFSDGIIPFIYSCAMERKTGRYIEGSTTMQMKYGTIIEPLIIRRAKEEYNIEIEQVGFKTVDDVPTLGASSDGIYKEKGKVKATCELKACCTWETHYKRTYEKTDESSIDFWQMIIQMLVWKVDKAYYFVCSPPKNIMDYILAEDPMDLYEKWCKETELSFEEVKDSEIHIEALKQRAIIVENCIQKYITTERPIADILEEEIRFHKKRYLDQEIPTEEIQQKEEVFKEDLFEDSPF